ncbi:MAG: hypothetical protein AMXMBFR67_32910 [Nitrospira sp.]
MKIFNHYRFSRAQSSLEPGLPRDRSPKQLCRRDGAPGRIHPIDSQDLTFPIKDKRQPIVWCVGGDEVVRNVGELDPVETSDHGKAGKDLCISVTFEDETLGSIQCLPGHRLGAELSGHDEFSIHTCE